MSSGDLTFEGSQTSSARTAVEVAADDDDLLVERYVDGDDDAFSILYERYRGPVYRYFKRSSDATVANDLYQETWLKFINSAHTYRPEAKFQAYLFRLAQNVLMDHYRKQKGAHLTDSIQGGGAFGRESEDESMEIEDPMSNLTTQLTAAELRQHLHREVARLPLHQRSTWVIKQESQLSLEQIARLTQTTLETVRSRLRYANDKLKQGMQRYV